MRGFTKPQTPPGFPGLREENLVVQTLFFTSWQVFKMPHNRSLARVSQPSAPAPSEVERGRVQQQSREDREPNLLH